MPQRRIPRLAYCEYINPGDKHNNTVAYTARRELIDSIKKYHAPMLESLSTDVFPAYAALAASGFNFDSVLWNPRRSPFTMLPDSQLKTALSEWAGKFHAETGWFLDEVLRTLRGWYVAPDWRESLRWNPIGGVTSTLAMGEHFSFDCEGWEMQLLTWVQYSQSVRERFEKKLSGYEEACRRLAESRGLVRAPHKYSPTNLDWFVMYQFAGLSSTKIANLEASKSDKGLDESTVLKGVRTASKLLGWERLRPRRKGRKPENLLATQYS